MSQSSQLAVPRIYATSPVPPRLSIPNRLVALAASLACLGVLITAIALDPSRTGMETHRQLGLAECQFLRTSGIPCPSCGMTTSFTWFVRGNVLASLYVQPMGTLLATGAACTFWAGLYIAITGKPVHRLMRLMHPSYYVLIPVGVGIAAWGWKIFIHLRGADGWA